MIKTSTFTLDNGLRVVHNYEPSTVMAGFDIIYNVGARDENPGLTGLAHLFEHLMFDGSVNIPDFDAAIEQAGGMNNAWTSSDFTNFYEYIPAVNIETAFWLESDRMLSPAFTQKGLDVQKGVVIEEFKQTCLNEPYGDMTMRLRQMLYREHPYRWPVIGLDPSHIERATMDEVKQFFFTHYAPNNAAIAVSGPLTLDATRRLAEKWFGPVPRREIAPRLYPQEKPLEGVRRDTMTGRVPQTMVVVAWAMPGYDSPDYVGCDLLTDILASGKSSRMHQELVMKGDLFSSADASIFGSDEPGVFMMTGKLLHDSDADIERAEAELLRMAQELVDRPVTEHELQRAINRYDSERTFGCMSVMSRAKLMAMALLKGNDVNERPRLYHAATVDSLHATARRVLGVPGHAVLVYRAQQSPAMTNPETPAI